MILFLSILLKKNTSPQKMEGGGAHTLSFPGEGVVP